MKENATTKGTRYLTEGRLIVSEVAAGGAYVVATCRGNGTVYKLGYERGRWWCDCPARGTCAHLVALQTVTATTRRAA